jgi:hypothetical protein
VITATRRHAARPNPYEVAIPPKSNQVFGYNLCDHCGKPIALWQSRAGLRWRHVPRR